jgi:hypothetical protein
MSKHTPGPWRWMEGELNDRLAHRLGKKSNGLKKKDGPLVYALKGGPIGNPGDGWDSCKDQSDYKTVMQLDWRDVKGDELFGARPSQADALLIAAAPDLLEAVEDLMWLAEEAMRLANRAGAKFDIAHCLADARAAIAKANGTDKQ